MSASSSSSSSSDNGLAPTMQGSTWGAVRLSEQVQRALTKVPLFAGLSHTNVQKIGATLVKRQVVPGEVVIRQGDTGKEMFVVESGRLQASVITPDGKDLGIVKTYREGEYFGELALMRDESRAATVTAMDEGTLLVLERQVVHRLLQDLHGTELSKEAATEALDVDFQRALQRRTNRRGAVVQQLDSLTGRVKLVSTNSATNPVKRVWANDMERARETDMRAVTTTNKLSALGELHAAALMGDLDWVQRVTRPEVEASTVLKQVKVERERHRTALADVLVKIKEMRLEIKSATADVANGQRFVDKLQHKKSQLEVQLEKCRSKATAAITQAKATGVGSDAEKARMALGTVNGVETRIDELNQTIEVEMHAGDIAAATTRLEDAKYHLNLAEYEQKRLKVHIARCTESLQHAQLIGHHINTPDRSGRTAVFFAVESGHLNVLAYLHKPGHARLDVQDEDGRNVLHVAANRGHQEIVEYLLAQEVRNLFLQTDKQGASALFVASYQGNPAIVGGIIMKSPRLINVPAADGTSPLFVACEHGNLEAVRLLIVHRADMEASREGGFTPLYIGCQQRHSDIVGLLLASKANVDHATNSGLTPLTACCHGGALSLAKILVEGGASAEQSSRAGRTACWVAAHSGRLQVLKWLVEECGVDVERPDNVGVTPLQAACENAHVAVAEYICSLPCRPVVALRRSRLLHFVTEFKDIQGSDITFAERVQAARGSLPHGAIRADDAASSMAGGGGAGGRNQSRDRSTSDLDCKDAVKEHAERPSLSDAEATALGAGGQERGPSSPQPRLGRRRGAVVLEEFLAQSVLGTDYQSEDPAKLTGISKQKQQQRVLTPPLKSSPVRTQSRTPHGRMKSSTVKGDRKQHLPSIGIGAI